MALGWSRFGVTLGQLLAYEGGFGGHFGCKKRVNVDVDALFGCKKRVNVDVDALFCMRPEELLLRFRLKC